MEHKEYGKTLHPHKEKCDNYLSSFVETTYSVYGCVFVMNIITNIRRDRKSIHYIIVCASTEYKQWGQTFILINNICKNDLLSLVEYCENDLWSKIIMQTWYIIFCFALGWHFSALLSVLYSEYCYYGYATATVTSYMGCLDCCFLKNTL